jgi:hypothetical protein
MRKLVLLIVLSLLMPLLKIAPAFEPPSHPPRYDGLYSDLRTGPEGLYHVNTKFYGTEVFIVTGKDFKYYAFIQYANNGSLCKPFCVEVSINSRSDNPFVFDVPSDAAPLGRFVGNIKDNRLCGTFSGNRMKIDIPKTKSFWE